MLRIAFDLDGVLADMDGELIRQARELFGASLADFDEENARGAPTLSPPPNLSNISLTSRQLQQLWKHVAQIDNFWGTLRELEPGVVARLARLSAERGWEVMFLTSRPPTRGATAQRQTQQWLEANGFPLPSVYVVQGSRGRIASSLALDFVVDDRPDNCLAVIAESEARALLVWRMGAAVPLPIKQQNIHVVDTMSACLDLLIQHEPPLAERAGMMSRVLKFLGWGEVARS